jgi:hypothetical protein
MAIFDVRQSAGGSTTIFSMQAPSAIDIVFAPGSMRLQGSLYVLAANLDSEVKINAAVDQLMMELEVVRQRARDVLKAKAT